MTIKDIRGRVIATYDPETNTVTKNVDPAKHLMKKTNSYGMDLSVYNAIQKSGAMLVFNIKGQPARRISAPKLAALKHITNYGHGTQAFIALHNLETI